VGIALSLPFVQTKNSAAFTNSINKDFGTIDAVRLSVFGGVKFKNVLLDHHKDTLIFLKL
jgi:hypothetical protein